LGRNCGSVMLFIVPPLGEVVNNLQSAILLLRQR
jgi:hypothetical protein